MPESFEKNILEKKKINGKEEFFEKPEGKKEKEKVEGLTDKEKEVFEKTPEGAILKYLEERFISSQKEFLLTTNSLSKEIGLDIINTGKATNNLIKEGVVEANKKMGTVLVKGIHAERIKEFFEKKFDNAEILQLIKEKPGLNTWQISGALHLDWPKVKSRINKLESLGLIKAIKGIEVGEIEGTVKAKSKHFFPPEFLEKAEKQNIIREIEKRREEEREKQLKRKNKL